MNEFRPWHKVPASMWMLAAVGAAAIHFGCVALAVAFLDREPDDEVGAPAVEIGVELLAPHSDTPDLPPGPDVEASIASPQTVEQTAVADQADLPRAIPVETEDPERVVAPVETKNPKDDPSAPAAATVASVELAAVEATAPPSSEMVAEFDTLHHARSGDRSERTARTGDMAERVDRSLQQAQTLSGEPVRTGRGNSRQLRARRDRPRPVVEHRPRDPATRPSTMRRWQWSGARTRCQRLRWRSCRRA